MERPLELFGTSRVAISPEAALLAWMPSARVQSSQRPPGIRPPEAVGREMAPERCGLMILDDDSTKMAWNSQRSHRRNFTFIYAFGVLRS